MDGGDCKMVDVMSRMYISARDLGSLRAYRVRFEMEDFAEYVEGVRGRSIIHSGELRLHLAYRQ
jgi:hypothetical protein